MAIETNTSYWVNAFKTRLDGEYKLQDLLSADADSAIFRTTAQENARFFHLNAEAAAHQVELWRSLEQTSHQNLLRIINCGETDLEGQPVAYVISESADESLVPVLQERSLTTEEAKGLLQSLASALSHLHASGFVHGRVCPAEIFASGETIKLSSDCARPIGEKSLAYRSFPAYLAPEQQDQNITPVADIWCLGASLFEVLTQSPFVVERRSNIAKLPAPLGRIVERCLLSDPSGRPTATEVLVLLNERAAPPAEVKAHGIEPAPESPIALPQFAAAYATPEPSRRKPLMLAAAAVILLLIVASIWWAKNRVGSAEASKTPDAKVVSTAQTTPPSAASPTPPPASVPATPEASADEKPSSSLGKTATPKATTPGPANKNAQIWRVILWTYGDATLAQNKVDKVAQEHPDLHPEVFTPDSNSKLHLVVVGGAMTRDQARELQQKVRQLDLPRDAYFQNFSH